MLPGGADVSVGGEKKHHDAAQTPTRVSRQRGLVDRSVVRIADEAIHYIGGRKEFWALQKATAGRRVKTAKKKRRRNGSEEREAASAMASAAAEKETVSLVGAQKTRN